MARGVFGFDRLKPATLVRLFLTVVLVLVLFWLVDWRAAAQIAADASWEWLMAAFAFILAARAVITVRWAIILRACGERVSFRRLFAIASAGFGLGAMMPTSIGQDVARGFLLHAESGPAPNEKSGSQRNLSIVSSLMLDRYAATLGTVVAAVIGALMMKQWLLALVLTIALVGVISLTGVLISGASRITPLITRITASSNFSLKQSMIVE